MNNQIRNKPTAGKFSLLRQICNFIPTHLVPKLARDNRATPAALRPARPTADDGSSVRAGADYSPWLRPPAGRGAGTPSNPDPAKSRPPDNAPTPTAKSTTAARNFGSSPVRTGERICAPCRRLANGPNPRARATPGRPAPSRCARTDAPRR